jgi:hypothetical protein
MATSSEIAAADLLLYVDLREALCCNRERIAADGAGRAVTVERNVTAVPFTVQVPESVIGTWLTTPVLEVNRALPVSVNVAADEAMIWSLSNSILGLLGWTVNGRGDPLTVLKFHVPAREMTAGFVLLSEPQAAAEADSASRAMRRRVMRLPY